MKVLFEAAQGITILAFLVPIVVGVLIGVLIILINERKKNKSSSKSVIVVLKFKDRRNFDVVCKETLEMIFCPICSFRNKKPYKMSKHLKGHLKKEERKELFIR